MLIRRRQNAEPDGLKKSVSWWRAEVPLEGRRREERGGGRRREQNRALKRKRLERGERTEEEAGMRKEGQEGKGSPVAVPMVEV